MQGIKIVLKYGPANPAEEHPTMKSPDDSELLNLENQLCFALYAASRAITGTYRDELSRLGLTYPQYLVLTVLWENDALSLTTIGRHLRLDSGTLTPLVKRLEAMALVTRNRRSTDEREIEIALTDAGRALKTAAFCVRAAVVKRLRMSEIDIGKMRSELLQLVETLDLNDSDGAPPAGRLAAATS